MVREKEIESLRSSIVETFPAVSYPSDKDLTYGTTAEEREIREAFQGMVWWDIPPSVLQRNYGSMAFLTPFAYHYFLPSYIMFSLDNFDSNNEVLMFTVFSLTPTKTA